MFFVVVTQDGNGQVFPLAIGIGDVECNESCSWFLGCLKRAYGCPPNLMLDTLRIADSTGRLMNMLITTNSRKWARVLCVFNRFEFMTSNVAETLNRKV
ncbi:hypothetical protein ACS0TY_029839 [Phlomoides rotata]